MSTENQAENAVSEEKNAAPKEQSEKPAKTAPPKPSKPKSSVIQIHPEGERIHPKKAEGRFAKLRIAAVLATQFVFYVIPWFNWSGRQAVLFNIPAFLHFRAVAGYGRLDLPCPAADDLCFRAVLVDDDCRTLVVRLFLPADGLHRNHAVDR